jgi:amino acid adenylation domain-containing protein
VECRVDGRRKTKGGNAFPGQANALVVNTVSEAPAIVDRLEYAAQTFSSSAAVSDACGTWTYGDLDLAADRVSGRLRDLGVGRGDRVVLRARNRREIAAVLFGAFRAGAVLVPLNSRLPPAGFAAAVADAEPAVVITDEIHVGVEVSAPVRSLEDVVSGAPSRQRHPTQPDETALLMYTSGSTATPKGVVCPHGAVDFVTQAIALRLRYRGDDVVLVSSPVSFDYGLYQLLLTVAAGSAAVLTDAEDPIRMERTMRRTSATVVPVVPSTARMLVRLVRRGAPVEHVRLLTNTGATLTAADMGDLREAFPRASITAMYGITECKRVTIADPDVDLHRPGSVGTALPGTRVQILAEDGQVLGPGVVGEIAAVGPHVMSGYRGAPEQTALRFGTDPTSGEPRLRTGDFGNLDADGHLYFHGRRDDQIKRRGVRMSLTEIEAAASHVGGVTAAAALAPTDERDLELVVCGSRSGDAVIAELEEVLEPAKVPTRCHVLDGLPLTTNGKTDRTRLRELVQPETRSAS